mmetsp:Transcript_6424/g.7140  ORF Transcript_6424/g.7140 Transcript_6424/m.7140 type:complete len:490 (+) Transcript_6424:70-1539(+)
MVLSPAARFLPYCALLCSAAEAFVVHRSTAATTATRGGATGSQILPHTQRFVATQDDSDAIFDGELWLKGAIRQQLDQGWNPEGVINGVPDKEFCPPGEQAPFPTKWEAPPGWKGGFAQSNPAFAYPQTHPDLSSIPVTTNLENIPKVTRMMKAKWPEFSWEMVPGNDSTRVFCRFTEYICRYGYDDEGQIWSFMCPQMGVDLGRLGEANVEVTVTGVRGYLDEAAEPSPSVALDLGVMGQIWLTSSTPLLMALLNYLFPSIEEYPIKKAKSIRIQTHEVGNKLQPLFRNDNGVSKQFISPPFTQHWDEASLVTNLEVQIGEILKNKSENGKVTKEVDDFNQMILNLFNLSSGNMLSHQNVLSWNIWLTAPQPVNQVEWKNHAAFWRESLDSTHITPRGLSPRTKHRRFDGSVEQPYDSVAFVKMELDELKMFMDTHYDHDTAKKRATDPDDVFTEENYKILGDLQKEVKKHIIEDIKEDIKTVIKKIF